MCYCHLSSCLSFPTKLKALDGLYTQCPAHKWVLRSLSNELYTCLPSLLSELLACAYLHQGPTHLPPILQVKGLSWHSRHSFHSVDSALLPGFELPTFFYIATPVFLSLVFSFSKSEPALSYSVNKHLLSTCNVPLPSSGHITVSTGDAVCPPDMVVLLT